MLGLLYIRDIMSTSRNRAPLCAPVWARRQALAKAMATIVSVKKECDESQSVFNRSQSQRVFDMLVYLNSRSINISDGVRFARLSEAITFAELAGAIEQKYYVLTVRLSRRTSIDMRPFLFHETARSPLYLDFPGTPHSSICESNSLCAGGMQLEMQGSLLPKIRKWLWQIFGNLKLTESNDALDSPPHSCMREGHWTRPTVSLRSLIHDQSPSNSSADNSANRRLDPASLIDELSKRIVACLTFDDGKDGSCHLRTFEETPSTWTSEQCEDYKLSPRHLGSLGQAYVDGCAMHALKQQEHYIRCVEALVELMQVYVPPQATELLVKNYDLLQHIVANTPPKLSEHLEQQSVPLNYLNGAINIDRSALHHSGASASQDDHPVISERGRVCGGVAYAFRIEYGDRCKTACDIFLKEIRAWQPLQQPFVPTIAVEHAGYTTASAVETKGPAERLSRSDGRNQSHSYSNGKVVLPSIEQVPMTNQYILMSTRQAYRGWWTGLDEQSERLVRLISVVWELIHVHGELKPGFLTAGFVSDMSFSRSVETRHVEQHLRQRVVEEGFSGAIEVQQVERELHCVDGEYEAIVAEASAFTKCMTVSELVNARTYVQDVFNNSQRRGRADEHLLRFLHEIYHLSRPLLISSDNHTPDRFPFFSVMQGFDMTLSAIISMRGRLGSIRGACAAVTDMSTPTYGYTAATFITLPSVRLHLQLLNAGANQATMPLVLTQKQLTLLGKETVERVNNLWCGMQVTPQASPAFSYSRKRCDDSRKRRLIVYDWAAFVALMESHRCQSVSAPQG